MASKRLAFVGLGISYTLGLLLVVGAFAWMTWTLRSTSSQTPAVPLPRGRPSADVTSGSGSLVADEAKRCASLDLERDRDDCWFGLAQTTLDLEVCARIVSSEWADTCVYQIAVTTLNPAACARVRRADDRQLCEERIPHGQE